MTPLEGSYDGFDARIGAFDELLDVSLEPRGPEILYDIVRGLALPSGAAVLDLGCGEGRHALRLAESFDFNVIGVDPVARHLELSRAALDAADPAVQGRVRFEAGRVESIPVGDSTIDLVWCRDVMVHISALDQAYREMRRVLRDGGYALIYQMFWGQRIAPGEGEWLWRTMLNAPEGAWPGAAERSITEAGFRIERRIDLTSEWGELAQETAGFPGRRLLHAARLLREPNRYVEAFGRDAYELKLADCLWHVYRMIGKLSPRVYLLAPIK